MSAVAVVAVVMVVLLLVEVLVLVAVALVVLVLVLLLVVVVMVVVVAAAAVRTHVPVGDFRRVHRGALPSDQRLVREAVQAATRGDAFAVEEQLVIVDRQAPVAAVDAHSAVKGRSAGYNCQLPRARAHEHCVAVHSQRDEAVVPLDADAAEVGAHVRSVRQVPAGQGLVRGGPAGAAAAAARKGGLDELAQLVVLQLELVQRLLQFADAGVVRQLQFADAGVNQELGVQH